MASHHGAMTNALRSRLPALFAPLSLAAYAAWASVWMSSRYAQAMADPASAWMLRIALLAFLIVFMVELLLPDRLQRPMTLALGVLAAGAALLAIALTPQGSSPILLVLLSGMLASRLAWPTLLAALLAINVAAALVVFLLWPGPTHWKLLYLFAFISFQIFAAMVMRYAAIAQEMSERLRATNADLVATRELLAESTRNHERLRVARELHDVAGHKLTALKLNLTALARDPRFVEEPQPRLCAQLADELLTDIRVLVERIRADEGIDLRQSLTALAQPFPRPQLHVEVADDTQAIGLAQAEAILRTAQEALTNAARHSQAQNLWLVLRRDGDQLQLDLRDDGRGEGELVPGNGLKGMRERIEALGGRLGLQRTATGGIHLQAWLPVPT